MARAALTFLKAFLRNPSQIGAIAPSSKKLARAMVQGIDLGPEELLVEFGPGTGAFTAVIAELLPQPGQYLGIERSTPFVTFLEKRFPELTFANDSAEALPRLIQKGQRVRAVVSGLPFASLPGHVQDGVLQALEEALPTGAQFRTFQYAHAYLLPQARRFRRLMDQHFGPHEERRIVFQNLPPAWVLSWRRRPLDLK
ncbi:MAG: SAM-dependent methyltransferase [Planctomycetota bacterium]|nr:MAG: SAM-dependent methyltransferase [Planctomycetota bacterium]